ncbi:hypothetical protein [Microbacterium sp. AK031]|uniref:hypothetical protein n=1 Tax=Microbacterium sp. AK031 TaxID=2723076 RepID=UPI002168CA3F|nr:hypothetical protein [Microbacterium sp. AK031]MCS3843752.1 hypothetical protein [Microbacterium sp. AK031]
MLVLAGLDEANGLNAESTVPDGDHAFGEEYLVPYADIATRFVVVHLDLGE